MPAANDDFYARQLIESLSDVVDTLNEAKADGHVFNFQISLTPDGKFYVLSSLTTTRQIVTAPPQAPNVEAPRSN